MKSKTKTIISVISTITLLFFAVYLKINFDSIKEQKRREELYTVRNKEDIKDFISSFGYTCEEISEDRKRIPFVFSDVYNEYNELQTEQGFDLSKYKGKEIFLYKCCVKDSEDSSYVTLVVYENLIIGCSVHSELNGGYIKALITCNS